MILEIRRRSPCDVFFGDGDQMTPDEGARLIPA